MMQNKRHQAARLAAAVSALAVLLAVISRFTGATIIVTTTSYMSFATVAILFAIYFRIGTLENK